MFLNNNLLCYENTVNWKDILTGENSEVMHHRSSTDMTRECERCTAVLVVVNESSQSVTVLHVFVNIVLHYLKLQYDGRLAGFCDSVGEGITGS